MHNHHLQQFEQTFQNRRLVEHVHFLEVRFNDILLNKVGHVAPGQLNVLGLDRVRVAGDVDAKLQDVPGSLDVAFVVKRAPVLEQVRNGRFDAQAGKQTAGHFD
uniref:(northern house mosquito) hypothetical protein n=1 Tax=Culex pipiens TaxID=7175 RepID=A0A8D8HK22_CULPI